MVTYNYQPVFQFKFDGSLILIHFTKMCQVKHQSHSSKNKMKVQQCKKSTFSTLHLCI